MAFRSELCVLTLLEGSWDLVSGVINKVTILITPIKVLITLLTKSHDPPSSRKAPGTSRASGIHIASDPLVYSLEKGLKHRTLETLSMKVLSQSPQRPYFVTIG